MSGSNQISRKTGVVFVFFFSHFPAQELENEFSILFIYLLALICTKNVSLLFYFIYFFYYFSVV